MKENKNIIPFSQIPDSPIIEDVLRTGAENLLKVFLEAEINAHIDKYSCKLEGTELQGVVRNGYHKERKIQTSFGPVSVKVPRSKNRTDKDIEEFCSSLIPKYLRRSLTLEEAVPYFYLAGLSNQDFEPCFEKLFGNSIAGYSSASITRLKKQWSIEHQKWQNSDLSQKKYCYLWADGIHFNLRLEDSRLCILVVLGAREDGVKELVAVEGGFRESKESWSSLLRSLSNRGLESPKLCIGDGALGFWAALRDVYPEAKEQRCWVHKIANVLDKLPKHIQPKAKSMIHQIYIADKKSIAKKNYNKFIETYSHKYPKATGCLEKSKEVLFTFFDFPAIHWQHIRSTNVIESTFATVRLRTKKTRGHGTMEMTLAMVFKLAERASQRWRKIKGYEYIQKVIEGVKFEDGIQLKEAA